MKQGLTKKVGGVVFSCLANDALFAYSADDDPDEPTDVICVKLENGSLWIYGPEGPREAEDWADAAKKLRGYFIDPATLSDEFEIGEVLRAEYEALPDASEPDA